MHMNENEKTRRKVEIERRKREERERGYPTNEAEARAKESWITMQGFNRLQVIVANDGLSWSEIAIGKSLPEFNTTPLPVEDAVADNPNKPATEREALLRKYRAGLKTMIKAGAIPGSILPMEELETQPTQRRKSAHVYIAKVMAGEGLHHKTLIERLASVCKQVGKPEFERLPGRTKADILIGEKVHPLSLVD